MDGRIFIFNRQEELQRILSNTMEDACPFFSDEYTERLATGDGSFAFSVPANHEGAQSIELEGYAAIPDLDGRLILFKIRRIEDERTSDGKSVKTVSCESASLELLHDVTPPRTFTDDSAKIILDGLTDLSGWEAGEVEWFGLTSFKVETYSTRLAAILDFAKHLGGELQFRVEFKGAKIRRRFVDIVQKRGNDNGARFEYGKDLVSVLRKEHTENLVTALYGIGKGDTDGTYKTFTNVSSGNPPKPPGQAWVGDDAARQRWGQNGAHVFGIYESDGETPEEILADTWAELQSRKNPFVEYEIDAALLERLTGGVFTADKKRLGDTVTIVDRTFNPPVYLEARVIEMTTSMTEPQRDVVKLANFVELTVETPEKVLRRLNDLIRLRALQWADMGEALIAKQPTAPIEPVDNMLWLDTSQIPNVWKRYVAATTEWVKSTPTIAAEVGAETPGGAQQKADGAETNAKNYADTAAGGAYTNSTNFTQDYMSKRISQQTTAPTVPELNDLWIDTTYVPHLWKRWDGTMWVKAVATDLTELDGLIQSGQIAEGAVTAQAIAANSITSNMISTLGLDAGVITFGTMSGANINLGGVNDTNGVLTVYDSDGELIAQLDGDAGGFSYLNVGTLITSNVVYHEDIGSTARIIYVAAASDTGIGTPDDENTGESWSSPLRTIGEALSRIPRSFDGEVHIYLASGQTFNESFTISGFQGDANILLRSSSTTVNAIINGDIRVNRTAAKCMFRYITFNGVGSASILSAEGSYGFFVACKFNGASSSLRGFSGYGATSYEIVDCEFSNLDTAITARYGGHAHVSNCTGDMASYGLEAFGGTVSGSGSAPLGAVSNTRQTLGGLVTGSFTYPAPPAPPPPAVVTVTTTWNATSDSGTWRTDENRWDIYGASVNNVTQGSWGGYGMYTGAFFFGTDVATKLTGKTIKRIRIYVSRVSGGYTTSQKAHFRPHTSASRPAGNVSVQTPKYDYGIAVGESKWITLPTSFHAGFASGSYKGIAITENPYVKLSKTAKLEVTYET